MLAVHSPLAAAALTLSLFLPLPPPPPLLLLLLQVTIIATGFSQTFEEQLLSGKGDAKAGQNALQRKQRQQQQATAATTDSEFDDDVAGQQQQQGWKPGRSTEPNFRGRTLL
jgi:hypothetical protein